MKRIDIPTKQNVNNTAINNRVVIGSIFTYYEGITRETLMQKLHNNISFNKNDLIYLYDIYNLDHSTWADSTLSYIRMKRSTLEDMSTIFDCSISEIATTQTELKNNPDKYIVLLCDLDSNFFNCEYTKLKYIRGACNDCYIGSINGRYPSLESIRTFANFSSLIDSHGLENLKSIGQRAFFNNLQNIDGLSGLEYIYDLEDSNFSSLSSSEKEKLKAKVKTKYGRW